MHKLNRIIAFLLACVTLALSLLVYFSFVYQLGFPDGFISELARAQRRLAYIFIGISLLFSAGFMYLGMVTLRKQMTKLLAVAVLLYVVVIVCVLMLNYYLNLTGSGGG